MASLAWSMSATRDGTLRSADDSRASAAASIAPRALAKAIAKHASAISCVVKALVDATPISGPASVGSTASDSRAILLSGTFTTERIFCPCDLQYFKGAMVSAVSPDWDTNSPSPFFDRGGSRYRNSEPTSASTGTFASISIQYLATRQA